jgi:hypothetical protein
MKNKKNRAFFRANVSRLDYKISLLFDCSYGRKLIQCCRKEHCLEASMMRTEKTFAATRRHGHARLGSVLMAAVLGQVVAIPNALAQTAAQLISARSTGLALPAGGNGDSINPLLSPDGRFVLFDSTAGNLVPGTGGQSRFQVYLFDRASNTLTLVSVNLNGLGGNGNSTYGGMSPDDRYVVFQSDASDLVAGDTNGATDILCGTWWRGRPGWPACRAAALKATAPPPAP